jgi:hypothetical protein
MAIKTVITCDVCDQQKKDVNHWWTVYVSSGEKPAFISFAGLEGEQRKEMRHVCGVEHAITMFNRFLNHGTLEMESPAKDLAF